MNRHENAPAEQAQNLPKDNKMETLGKGFEDILAATSDYYGEAPGGLADGEPPSGSEDPS